MRIQKAEFIQKLNKVKDVIPKKPSMQVLKGALVKDGYLIASNTEITVKAKIEGTEGELFIIPERAFDLINNLPDGEIEIAASDENNILIEAEKIKNKYQTMDADSFPFITDMDAGSEARISADALLKSIKRVAFAISAHGENSVMMSMYLSAADGQLNFTGLDGHVIAWDKIDYEGSFELLIPKNTVEKIKSVGLSGEVQIKYNKSSVAFITDELEVYSRLTEGNYLKFQKLFKELPIHTVISRNKLHDAVTRAKVCTEELRPLKFCFEGKSLNLSINDGTTEYAEEIELQEAIEKKFEILFNAKLMMETLKAFDCDNVGISLEGPKMPMIIEAENSDFEAIILPIAL